MYSLTCQAISPPMWEALPLIAEVFEVSKINLERENEVKPEFLGRRVRLLHRDDAVPPQLLYYFNSNPTFQSQIP